MTKMAYLIIAGIIVLIIVSVRYAKKIERNPDHPYNKPSQDEITIDTTVDNPVGFGYKCMWFAIKTDNQQKVADLIGVNAPKQSNWKSGIDNAYDKSIFITPTIDGWTLAVGLGLPPGDSKESLEKVKELLKKLSKEFGEANFFCTHRVVEYHCWIKSTNGKIDRSYSYLGESGENIDISGDPTDIEKTYSFINTFSEEAKQDDYWDREDLTYPDEELVMKIAGEWSIDPTKLDNRKDINGLGLVGKRK